MYNTQGMILLRRATPQSRMGLWRGDTLRGIIRRVVWATAQGTLGYRGGAITIQFSIMYVLGVRAVKGADADEVLFVG